MRTLLLVVSVPIGASIGVLAGTWAGTLAGPADGPPIARSPLPPQPPACLQAPALGTLPPYVTPDLLPIPSGPTGSPLEVADPGSAGLSVERLREATLALEAHIQDGDVAGVVAAVARDGKLVYGVARGCLDLEEEASMPFDALFRIYSMTRPITALAILMLQDDGLLDLDDPVQRYLPAFSAQGVLEPPGAGASGEARPRTGDVTLAQLLTHTSGIGSRNSERYRSREVHRWDRTLEEVVDGVAALPLFEDPGTRYRYGMHSEVLGRVIEVVSGQSLPDFLHTRIFEPLGMTDTSFFVDPARRPRLATVHRPDEEGRLRTHRMESIEVDEPRRLVSAGVGLVSTAMDLLRFGQFLLDDGRIQGRRLLSTEGVQRMSRNAVPDALLPLGERGYWAGSGWTLGGFAVVLDPTAYGHTIHPDVFWWDGSAGTRFWIDPREGMVVVVLAQVSPAGGNGFREGFKDRVRAAIEDDRGADLPAPRGGIDDD